MPRYMPQETERTEKKESYYTFEDAMNITDDFFKMQKEKQYHPGAFIHALLLTLELTQQNYNIPQQQLAEVKRSVRRYVQEMKKMMISEKQSKE
ncbi:MAG: hypothetical protein QCH96_05780 [Candidatus Thermoplasmatota archaeon]|jgi:hypothetical protein|nr:hypothetical protein [Candidatus Thermoplasmatota archaeon]